MSHQMLYESRGKTIYNVLLSRVYAFSFWQDPLALK